MIPWPIRSARSCPIASQTVSGPVVSPACGTLCRPAAAAAANTSRITPVYGARPSSIPPIPKPVSAAGGFSSASRSAARAWRPALCPGKSMMYPIRTPDRASASRAPASSASVMTASGMPASWNAYGDTCSSAYRTFCAARSVPIPRTRVAMSSGSVSSLLTAP